MSGPGFRSKFKDTDVAVTFRDLILLPGWTEVEPNQVQLSTQVTVNHSLNMPFVASPMDTVTESEMAIAVARLGALGVLHRNCTLEEEVEMAKKVKRAESLVIKDVITIRPTETVEYATELMQKHNISGLPVVEAEKLVGIVTGRDVRFADSSLLTKDVMTKKVITAPDDTNIEDAKEILHDHRVEKLPLIDKEGRLKGLMTIKDILLRGRFPDAARDENGQLLCGAAVSPFDLKRAKKLSEIADILVIDVSHFHNANVFAATKKILEEVDADVVVGSIGTYKAAEDAITKLEGIAGFRVGIGSGSICTTMEATKAGSPTVYATALEDPDNSRWRDKRSRRRGHCHVSWSVCSNDGQPVRALQRSTWHTDNYRRSVLQTIPRNGKSFSHGEEVLYGSVCPTLERAPGGS